MSFLKSFFWRHFSLVIGAAAGLSIAYLVARTEVPSFLLSVGGEFTTAVVIDTGENEEGDWVQVEFKARNGRTYRGGGGAEERVGDHVLIEYLPRSPEINELRTDRSLESKASLIVRFTLFAAFVAGCLWPSGLLVYRLFSAMEDTP